MSRWNWESDCDNCDSGTVRTTVRSSICNDGEYDTWKKCDSCSFSRHHSWSE